MSQELLVFQHTVEGLIRALGDKLDLPTSRRLKEAGLDVQQILPAYPLQTWLGLMDIAAEVIHPGAADKQEAMYAFGRRFLDGYADTLLGKALLALVRVLGPKRTLERMTRNFRSGNNYSETSLTERGPNHFELRCNHVNNAGWYRGLITAGMERAGAKNVRLAVLAHDHTGATFEVRFD